MIESKVRARVWSKVEKGCGPDKSCWCWTGSKSNIGILPAMPLEPMGVLRVGSRTLSARRVMWEMCGGVLDPTRHVRAKCGTTFCVRPSHLTDRKPVEYREDTEITSELPISDEEACVVRW